MLYGILCFIKLYKNMFYKYFKLSLFVFFINILFFTNFCNAQLKDYSGMGGQANKTAETAGFDSGVGGGDAIGGIIALLIKAFFNFSSTLRVENFPQFRKIPGAVKALTV